MQHQSFRQKLLARQTLIGTLVTIASPEIIESLSALDFDWIFIDAEHGALGPAQIQALLQAAHACPCLVRIPAPDEGWVKKTLDAGASGLIVPQINTLQEAEAVVRYAKYPPKGKRGVGLGRAHGYGKDFSTYLNAANQETVIVLQAETQAALDNIDAIASLDAVDAILVGPYDLSASLGVTGELTHQKMQQAIQHIKAACDRHSTPLGIFGIQATDVAPYRSMGFTLLAMGVDTVFLQSAATQELEKLRHAE